MILAKWAGSCPCRHWKTALCSLSMGSMRTCCSLALAITNSPAATNDSLLASPISLPASMAAKGGQDPPGPHHRNHYQLCLGMGGGREEALGPRHDIDVVT